MTTIFCDEHGPRPWLFGAVVFVGGLLVSYLLDGWHVRIQVTIYHEVRPTGAGEGRQES